MEIDGPKQNSVAHVSQIAVLNEHGDIFSYCWMIYNVCVQQFEVKNAFSSHYKVCYCFKIPLFVNRNINRSTVDFFPWAFKDKPTSAVLENAAEEQQNSFAMCCAILLCQRSDPLLT